MTTDITELVLIAKIKKQLKNFDTVVLKEGEALALVEALEKAQSAKRTLESLGYTDNGGELWRPPIGPKPNFSLMDSYRHRIAELESRTVKLPEPEQWDITQVLLCKKKTVAAIRAAGIKVEAE